MTPQEEKDCQEVLNGLTECFWSDKRQKLADLIDDLVAQQAQNQAADKLQRLFEHV